MSSHPLAGVIPVFQTPLRDDESIDAATLEKEIAWLYDCGADGIAMAMVSELLRLDSDERRTLAELACRFGSARGAVVISVGAESSILAERYARHAHDAGAAAVMAIPPVATALPESELMRYYQRIARAVSIPLIVQDASGYVGRPMSVALQARLLDEFGPERVLFKPEATPIGPRLTELRSLTAGRAKVFEGTGGLALVDSFRRGIVGTMPGADLVKAVAALWDALHRGDEQRAYRISLPLGALLAMQTSFDAFLAVEKYLLVKQGVFPGAKIRGPVGYAMDDQTRSEVDRLFDLLTDAFRAA